MSYIIRKAVLYLSIGNLIFIGNLQNREGAVVVKSWRAFTAAALSFCLVLGLAAPASAAAEDLPEDVSAYEDWDIQSTQPIIVGSSNDELRTSFYSSGSFVDTNSVYGTTSFSYKPTTSITYNQVRFAFLSTTATVTAGSVYRFKGSILTDRYIVPSGASLMRNSNYTGLQVIASDFKFLNGQMDFNIIIYAESSKTFSGGFEISIPSTTCPSSITLSYDFSGNALEQITEPVEAGKTIEEWLQDIFNTIKSGVTGEGDPGVTSPEIDAGVSDATDYQTQIDAFQDTVIGDFNTNFAELDLGSFAFPAGVLSAMSWISGIFMDFYNKAGDLQYLVIFPCLVGISLMIIGRGSRAMVSSSMRSRSKGDDG